jgi:galactitol-specific phosphotransferase system IIB component
MKYFTIINSTGKEIGKNFPQLKCLKLASAHQFNAWEFPEGAPKLEFELSKNAKLTDVLSDSALGGSGFIVNEKVKDILSKYNCITHKHYDVKVIEPKTAAVHHYFYIHLCNPDLSKFIDYEQSVFYETKYTFREELIKIKSYQHYADLKAQDTEAQFGVELEEIKVNDQFDKSLHLFTFLPFTSSFFITKQLKDELVKNNISGFHFTEAPEVKI